jgi:hypothetical protein
MYKERKALIVIVIDDLLNSLEYCSDNILWQLCLSRAVRP